MTYKIILTKPVAKDIRKLKSANLLPKCGELLKLMSQNPFILPYEKLVGDLNGYYSRRINIQHRLVYEIDQNNKIIKVLKMWSHYDGI